ncbi:hypothetical protein [Pandoraea sp. CB10b_02]|uniref:hypothetical protein n=1 Tax=Pandoraea sp. CB10b_02 TaxID=2014535 RepID=UPI00257F8D63|nr:hypothetical protein [Pandoraea sp. CB10b_02]
MKPQIVEREQEHAGHQWTVCINICDLHNVDDPTVAHMVAAVRDAYGEGEILAELADIEADPAVARTFDVESILAGFRRGLPAPDAEAGKPANLRNYRSETSEFVARETLRIVFDVTTPPTLHATKGNALQPLLGYDGWGLLTDEDSPTALVLIQVKGSDDHASPPAVAEELAAECQRAATEIDKLAHALSACLLRVKGTPLAVHLLEMLEAVGRDELPAMVVAPVVVRGQVTAQMSDLQPLKALLSTQAHPVALGVSITIGAPLERLGYEVMSRARQQ